MKIKHTKILSVWQCRRLLATLSMGVMLLIFSNQVMAQKNWSLSLRSGANFTTTKLGDSDLKTGYGIEGTIAYKFLPSLAIYTGWGWNKFNTDRLFTLSNIDIVETGYRAGLQITAPIGTSNLKYLISGGGLYNHLEVENSEGKMTDDSGHGYGWEAEGGIVIPLGSSFSLTPTVRYHSLTRDLKNGNLPTQVNLKYVSAGLGLALLF
jgi:Outer membrane protein beta-barrel domain